MQKSTHCFIRFLLVSLLASPINLFSIEKEEPSLFEGMQIMVEKEGQSLPVIGIDGERYVVLEGDKVNKVSPNTTIELKGTLKFSKEVIDLEEKEILITSAERERLLQQRNQFLGLQMTNRVMIDVKNETVSVEEYDTGDNVMELERQMAEALKTPDTLIAQFKITPHRQYDELYLLGVAHFIIEQEGRKRMAIKGQMSDIGDVDAHETKELELLIPELPTGFELDHVAYHFYTGGREIPTPLSAKRRILDDEELYQYMFLQYLGMNEGKSRGPSLYQPLKGTDFEAYLKEERMSEVLLSVVIDEDGNLADVEVKSGLDHHEKEVCQLASKAKFFPSLKNGEPEKRKITVRLSQIAQ